MYSRSVAFKLGMAAPMVAERLLQRLPKWIPPSIRLSLALGRGQRTKWGKKSIALIAAEVRTAIARLPGATVESVVSSLGIPPTAAALLRSAVKDGVVAPVVEPKRQNFDDAVAKLAAAQEEGALRDAIEGMPATEQDDVIEAWVRAIQEGRRNRSELERVRTASAIASKIRPLTSRLLLARIQCEAMLGEFLLARDYLIEYGELFPVTESVSSLLGQMSIKALRRSFAGDHDIEEPHPLLRNDIALDYIAKLPERNAALHTEVWTASQRMDRRVRRLVREAQDRQVSDQLQVLFVSDGNWTFLVHYLEHLEKVARWRIRTCDTAAWSKHSSATERNRFLYAPLAHDESLEGGVRSLEAHWPKLRELLSQTDVVFCEWANAPAILMSKFLTGPAKVVVRVHSYEAFTHWIRFINLAGVDGFVFVSEHIRRFADAQIGFTQTGIPSIVCPNVKDYDGYVTEKVPGAEHTLGMAGFNSANKGLYHALQLLAALQRESTEWKLRLAGDHFRENSPDWAYWLTCEKFIDERKLREHVIFDGYQQDVAKWLPRVGYIVSASDREGTHEALVEGIISGAIPIVKDWTMVKPFGGIKTLYPMLQESLFDNILEAVPYIKSLEGRYENERLRLSAQMREMHDFSKNATLLSQFIEEIHHG